MNQIKEKIEMDTSLAIMPSTGEWTQIKEIAATAVKSGLLPSSVNTPEKAAVIALKGRELGLPPMVSFAHINVIQGKPTMSAEIMLAFIYKDYPNADIVIKERSEKRCEIWARRPIERENGVDYTKFVWDLERAKKMGLADKDNWRKQPGTMLFWRNITEMKRAKFPEVLMGIDYSPEEITESADYREAKTVEPASTTIETTAPVKTTKNLKTFAPQTKQEADKVNSGRAEAPAAAAEVIDIVPTPENESQEPAPPTRAELVQDLLECQKALKMDNKSFTAEIKNITGKGTKELTDHEIGDLTAVFEARVREQLEGA